MASPEDSRYQGVQEARRLLSGNGAIIEHPMEGILFHMSAAVPSHTAFISLGTQSIDTKIISSVSSPY